MADYRRAEAILTSPLPPSQSPDPLPAEQVDQLFDQEHSPTALPDCELEKPSATCDRSGLPFHPQTGGPKVNTALAAGLQNSSSVQDHARTDSHGGFGGIITRTPTLNMASSDTGPTSQQAVGSQAGSMVESSMACKYLATLCLVCLLAGRFWKSSFRSAGAPRKVERGAFACWRIKSICIDRLVAYFSSHGIRGDSLAYPGSDHSKRKRETGDLKVSEVLRSSAMYV